MGATEGWGENLEGTRTADILDHHDIMEFIGYRKIMNKGIGYVGVHLLGSALVSETPLLTFDKPLRKIANQLSIEYDIKISQAR